MKNTQFYYNLAFAYTHTHTPSERARKTAEAVIAISEKQTSLTHAKSHTKLKPTWPKTAHIQDYAHTVYLLLAQKNKS